MKVASCRLQPWQCRFCNFIIKNRWRILQARIVVHAFCWYMCYMCVLANKLLSLLCAYIALVSRSMKHCLHWYYYWFVYQYLIVFKFINLYIIYKFVLDAPVSSSWQIRQRKLMLYTTTQYTQSDSKSFLISQLCLFYLLSENGDSGRRVSRTADHV